MEGKESERDGKCFFSRPIRVPARRRLHQPNCKIEIGEIEFSKITKTQKQKTRNFRLHKLCFAICKNARCVRRARRLPPQSESWLRFFAQGAK
jgi:hypothetical protein